jgi:hypothetical protein
MFALRPTDLLIYADDDHGNDEDPGMNEEE